MAEAGHRFTYTEDPHSGQVRTLAVDGVRWLSPREAALQAQATADKARADEREKWQCPMPCCDEYDVEGDDDD